MTTAYPRRHQRPFNHPPAEECAGRRRWCRDTWISATGFMRHAQLFRRPQCKLNGPRSQSARPEHRFCHCARSRLGRWHTTAPDQYGFTPFYLPPPTATITNTGEIALATMVPIHITPRRRGRRRRKVEMWHSACGLSLSLSLINFLSRIRRLVHRHTVVVW